MPQPLTDRQREKARISWGFDSLQKRPDCALGVAKVASAWAFLEFELVAMFFSATGDWDIGEDGEAEGTGHPLAVAALGSLESTSAKLDVIAAGIESYVPSLSVDFEQLKIGIRQCAKERNKVVHAVWGTSEKYPRDVIRVVTFDDAFIKYTPRDFDSITKRIKTQVDRVSEFHDDCGWARKSELLLELGEQAQELVRDGKVPAILGQEER